MSLSIETEERGDVQRMGLRGRLDTNTAPQLDEAVAAVVAPGVRALVFDLSALEYISSAGVRTVFRAEKLMKTHGGRVCLVDPQAPVKKVFEIVKALPTESIFASWDELDEYLDGIQRRVRDEE